MNYFCHISVELFLLILLETWYILNLIIHFFHLLWIILNHYLFKYTALLFSLQIDEIDKIDKINVKISPIDKINVKIFFFKFFFLFSFHVS